MLLPSQCSSVTDSRSSKVQRPMSNVGCVTPLLSKDVGSWTLDFGLLHTSRMHSTSISRNHNPMSHVERPMSDVPSSIRTLDIGRWTLDVFFLVFLICPQLAALSRAH